MFSNRGYQQANFSNGKALIGEIGLLRRYAACAMVALLVRSMATKHWHLTMNCSEFGGVCHVGGGEGGGGAGKNRARGGPRDSDLGLPFAHLDRDCVIEIRNRRPAMGAGYSLRAPNPFAGPLRPYCHLCRLCRLGL